MNKYPDDDTGAEPQIGDLFPFLPGEEELVRAISIEVRGSLSSLDAATLKKISTFLFALEQLPYTTAGVSMDLGIVERFEGSTSYVSVELTEQEFRLSRGGHDYTPGVGGDSYSSTSIHLEAGGFREGSTADFHEWLEAFRFSGGAYSLTDNGEQDVDLSGEAPGDGWDRLAKYWEAVGTGAFGY